MMRGDNRESLDRSNCDDKYVICGGKAVDYRWRHGEMRWFSFNSVSFNPPSHHGNDAPDCTIKLAHCCRHQIQLLVGIVNSVEPYDYIFITRVVRTNPYPSQPLSVA